MKPVKEVQQETAEVLGNAVAEVARRAIRPELDPFKQSIIDNFKGHAQAIDKQVQAEKKALEALEALNKQLGELVATGKSQAAAAADMQAQIQEVRERLDAVTGELASTRDDQATTVAALNSLRDEVLGWMRASNEQAEQLASVLRRAKDLADALGNQARAFTDFADKLSGQVDARTTEVLQGIEREATELKNFLGNGFLKQDASFRAAASDLVTKVDASVKSITNALASDRQNTATEMASFSVAHQTRQDAATAELKVVVEALRSEMVEKINGGFLHTIDRLGSSSQKTLNDFEDLRTAAETKFILLQKELEAALDKLGVWHEGYGSDLSKNSQTAAWILRLTVVNFLFLLIALALGGVALWVSLK